MTNDYPLAEFHLPLREVFPGVWIAPSQVAMSIPLGMKIRFSRNTVVLAPDFDNLISAHGTPKLGGAKQALGQNVERMKCVRRWARTP